jgi:hypothetical protein
MAKKRRELPSMKPGVFPVKLAEVFQPFLITRPMNISQKSDPWQLQPKKIITKYLA